MEDYYNYDYEDVEITVMVLEVKGKCMAGLRVGDKWRFPSKKTPNGLCSWAYQELFPYITALAYGNKLPWEREEGVATACCSDPINTVTFKIERGKKIKIT